MRRAAYVFCCAFSLGLAGCISGPWQAQRFPSADPLANASVQPPSPDVASLPQPARVQTARSERGTAATPDLDRTGSIAASVRQLDELTPGARSLVAQLVAHEYGRDSIGPAEISLFRGNGAPRKFASSFRLRSRPIACRSFHANPRTYGRSSSPPSAALVVMSFFDANRVATAAILARAPVRPRPLSNSRASRRVRRSAARATAAPGRKQRSANPLPRPSD